MALGLERFVREAAAAGVSGLVLTDFPAGADPELEAMVQASPLALIRLLAPTTTPDRLARAVQGASGFLYLISRLGDRKSTRLNSSHSQISYAVFCLKKKKQSPCNLICRLLI